MLYWSYHEACWYATRSTWRRNKRMVGNKKKVFFLIIVYFFFRGGCLSHVMYHGLQARAFFMRSKREKLQFCRELFDYLYFLVSTDSMFLKKKKIQNAIACRGFCVIVPPMIVLVLKNKTERANGKY